MFDVLMGTACFIGLKYTGHVKVFRLSYKKENAE